MRAEPWGLVRTNHLRSVAPLTVTYFSICLFLWHVVFSFQGNLRHWLEDPDCRDQYSVIYDSGERTGIYASDAKEPIEIEERAVSSPVHLKNIITMGPCVLYSVSFCYVLLVALDRNIRALVSKRHLSGHIPSERHRSLGRWEVQADPEVQSSGGSAHWFLTLWEVCHGL